MVLAQWALQEGHDKKFWFTASLLINVFYSVSGMAKQVMYRHRDGHIVIKSVKLKQFL